MTVERGPHALDVLAGDHDACVSPDDQARRTQFTPWHTGGGLRRSA